jgi:hypothetical protein
MQQGAEGGKSGEEDDCPSGRRRDSGQKEKDPLAERGAGYAESGGHQENHLHGKGKKIPNPLDPKLNHVEGALVGHQDPQKIHEKGEQDNKKKGVGDEISRPEVQFPCEFLESPGAYHRENSFPPFRDGSLGDPDRFSITCKY